MKQEYTNTEIIKAIDERVHNAKHREILKDRFVDGMLFKELSDKHGYSIQRVKAIVYKYDKKIFL